MTTVTATIREYTADLNRMDKEGEWLYIDFKSEHDDFELMRRVGTKKEGVCWERYEVLTGKTRQELLENIERVVMINYNKRNEKIIDTIKRLA